MKKLLAMFFTAFDKGPLKLIGIISREMFRNFH